MEYNMKDLNLSWDTHPTPRMAISFPVTAEIRSTWAENRFRQTASKLLWHFLWYLIVVAILQLPKPSQIQGLYFMGWEFECPAGALLQLLFMKEHFVLLSLFHLDTTFAKVAQIGESWGEPGLRLSPAVFSPISGYKWHVALFLGNDTFTWNSVMHILR